MIRIGCFVIFVVTATIIAVSAAYLPWWGTLLVVIGLGATLCFVIPLLIKFGLTRFAKGLFETKSRVLRGARVDVHSIRWTEKPELIDEYADDDEPADDAFLDEVSDEVAENLRYVLIEATIQPKPGQSQMAYYDPSEILLVPFDKQTAMSMLEQEDEVEGEEAMEGVIASVALVRDDNVFTTDFDKLTDVNRLRFVFAVPQGLTGRVKFQYYFESLGDIQLPA